MPISLTIIGSITAFNDIVTFDIAKGEKGLRAENVILQTKSKT
jgi:hypothetical protein